MNWFTRLTKREYNGPQRITVLLLGQLFFWVGFPLLIIVGSSYIDGRFHLPRVIFGLTNSMIAMLLIAPGWLLAQWTVGVQFFLGEGTPIPLVPRRRLVVEGPYAHCRNPMALGTIMVYLGVAVWIGSLSAVGLASVYPTVIVVYIKLLEEKELEKRFGGEYLEYKRRTPFLLPHFWNRD